MGCNMGCNRGCFSCTDRCADFFKQFQTNWDEMNEYSPQYLQNRPDNIGGVTPDELKEILKLYVLNTKLTQILLGYVETDTFNTIMNEIYRVLGKPSDYTNMAITLLADLDFRYGVNVVSTVSNMPVSKQSVVANLSGNGTLSLSGNMKPGQVINIQANPSAALKVTFPTGWVYMNGADLDLNSGETAEINIWCTGMGQYSVKTIIKE